VTTHTTDTTQQEADRGEQTPKDERPLTTADISDTERPDDREEAARSEAATRQTATSAPTDETAKATQDVEATRNAPLFAEDAATELRDRWTEVQTGFVDEPRKAVEQADALVADVMKRLADSFATERQALEQQWSKGDDVSTEELRISLRRYRSFFDRLLSV
jgi:hypothetical protein